MEIYKVVFDEPDYQGTMQVFVSLECAKKYAFSYEGKAGFEFVQAEITGGGYLRRPSTGFPGKFDCIHILEAWREGKGDFRV